METELFFPFPQFNEEDDDKVKHDKQSASFFDDANENMEDKEPGDNVSGESLMDCCGAQDNSDALNLPFGVVCLWSQPLGLSISCYRGWPQGQWSADANQQDLREELPHRGAHPHLPDADDGGWLPGLPDHLRPLGEIPQPCHVGHLQGGGHVCSPRLVWRDEKSDTEFCLRIKGNLVVVP